MTPVEVPYMRVRVGAWFALVMLGLFSTIVAAGIALSLINLRQESRVWHESLDAQTQTFDYVAGDPWENADNYWSWLAVAALGMGGATIGAATLASSLKTITR